MALANLLWGGDRIRETEMIAERQQGFRRGERNKRVTAPGAVKVRSPKAAISGGFEFTFWLIGSSTIGGYLIWKSDGTASNAADMIDFIPQPPFPGGRSFTYQDTDAGNPNYWVSAVNAGTGREGPRIAMAGTGAVTPPPSGGGGGGWGGGGGGGGGGEDGSLIFL